MSDFKIIDSHMHMDREPAYLAEDYGMKQLLDLMDRLEIECAISSTMTGLDDMYARAIEMDNESFKQSGGRIFSFFCFSPRHTQPSLDLIRANRKNKIYRGIKIHPSGCNINADDDSWIPIWELAKELKLPILAHTWNISYYHPSQQSAFAGRFERFVSAYPEVDFIFAHSGGRFDGVIEAARIGREHPNAYFDIAGDINGMGVLDYLYDNVGADRIMYGSDAFMLEQRPMLGIIYGSNKLSNAEKEKVLRYNAEKVYFSDLGGVRI